MLLRRSLRVYNNAFKLGHQIRLPQVRRAMFSTEHPVHPRGNSNCCTIVKPIQCQETARLKDLCKHTVSYQYRQNESDQPFIALQEALAPLFVSELTNNETCRSKLEYEKRKDFRLRAARKLFLVLAKEAGTALSTKRHSRQFSSDTTSSKSLDNNADSNPDSTPAKPTIPPDELSGSKDDLFTQFNLPDSIPTQPGDHTADAEAYRSIRSQQITNFGKAREKTASNVRRALAGNIVICLAKLGAWLSSGSSSMLSEFVHSVVDCGNQSLLLVGLRDAENKADRKHPYGYGKSVYFWALVSALGTFFLGAGVSMTHAVGELMEPSLQEITWEVWGVLGLSLTVDGYVMCKTIAEIYESKPSDKTIWAHIKNLRDPATLAILLEDGAACLGVVMAFAGISAAHVSGMPVFDGLAGVGISALLASMGLILVRVNHRFLLGQAVDREITEGIEKILLSQKSIDNVQSVQSQWTSSDSFAYKAEVDFDGTYLAAKLMPRYQREFLKGKNHDLRVLLSWYAEDVIRTVEREVRHCETEIRRKYPGAEYIELEPMSKDYDRFAIDDGLVDRLQKLELHSITSYLKAMYQETPPPAPQSGNGAVESTNGGEEPPGSK